MRFTLLIFSTWMLMACSKSQETTTNGYFPNKAFSEREDLDQFISGWYTHQLHALGEEPIYPRKENHDLEIYRFTLLRTFHNPISIRVDVDEGGQAKLILSVTDGHGGYDPGKVKIREEQTIKKNEVNRIRDLFASLTSGDYRHPLMMEDWMALNGLSKY